MKLPIVFLTVLLLTSFVSAWTLQNIAEFDKHTSIVLCQNQTLNISDILLQENGSYPTFSQVQQYVNTSTCEAFIRGSYYWYQLTYPKNTCPDELNAKVHEWFNLSDWSFQSCGVNISKSSLNRMMSNYALGYLEKTLTWVEPIEPAPSYNYTAPQPFLGGGGLPQPSKNWFWFSIFGIPILLVILELFLFMVSFKLATKLWTKTRWVEGSYTYSQYPWRKVCWVFFIANIIWWIAFFFVLK